MRIAKLAILVTVAILSISSAIAAPASAGAAGCGFAKAFERPDEAGKQKLPVYRAQADPGIGGAMPLAFVSPLKVNTDGTRISYKVDDPRARNGAINDIRNALRKGKTIADFEAIAAANWLPLAKTWSILSSDIIEKDTRPTGKGMPCVDTDKYLISMTADVSIAGGFDKQGDCDPSKWIDALTIPAIVLPSPSGGSKTEFDAVTATVRSAVVVMTLAGPRRLVFGIVGDKGPPAELGEATVEMNRMLNGLPEGAIPKSYADAVARFQGPKSIVLIFPGKQNRLPYPVTPDRVAKFTQAIFDAWGGETRLVGCLGEIPEAR